MKPFRLAALSLLLATSSAFAQPSEASIDELMEITAMRSMTDSLMGSLDQLIRRSMADATRNQPLTAEQRRALDAAPARILQVIREEMNWQTLRPIYVQVYRETLSQAEVDGMIEFYKTPVGQATIRKMPALMQRSMELTQARMQGMLPKIEAAMKQVLAEAGVKP